MLRFQCDYQEGAHPSILKKMKETNYEQTAGYGNDPYCESARKKIRRLCNAPEADVHFLVGGTQTNFTVISAILRPYQGALAAVSGHINVHETGAIEATGHKVLALPSEDGKITAPQVREAYEAHWNDADHEHIVQPGMVYISHPTENGTLYAKEELQALSRTCRELGLPLFLDGARLGYGLMAEKSSLGLTDIAELTDVFYIGGTKNGALFGEALVIRNDSIKKDFRYMIKQNGAMLAKGWLLGIQFETLFTDGLFYEMAAQANELAQIMRKGFEDCQIPFLSSSASNQLFPIVDDSLAEKLMRLYGANAEKKTDDTHTAIRFVTSWATPREAAQEFVRELKAMV